AGNRLPSSGSWGKRSDLLSRRFAGIEPESAQTASPPDRGAVPDGDTGVAPTDPVDGTGCGRGPWHEPGFAAGFRRAPCSFPRVPVTFLSFAAPDTQPRNGETATWRRGGAQPDRFVCQAAAQLHVRGRAGRALGRRALCRVAGGRQARIDSGGQAC